MRYDNRNYRRVHVILRIFTLRSMEVLHGGSHVRYDKINCLILYWLVQHHYNVSFYHIKIYLIKHISFFVLRDNKSEHCTKVEIDELLK